MVGIQHKMIALTFVIPSKLKVDLVQKSREQGNSQGSIIRTAIYEYLERCKNGT